MITQEDYDKWAGQQLFNHVAHHLFEQGGPCMIESQCVYRNDQGMACAAGCLVPDEKYDPGWEELANTLANAIVYFSERKHLSLVCSLQRIHDKFAREVDRDWAAYLLSEVGLPRVASRHGLNFDAEKWEKLAVSQNEAGESETKGESHG